EHPQEGRRERRGHDDDDERHPQREEDRREDDGGEPRVDDELARPLRGLRDDERREQPDGHEVRDARRRRTLHDRRRHEVARELEREHGDRRQQHDVPERHDAASFRGANQLKMPTTIATTAAASTGTPGGSHGMRSAATTAAAAATAIGWSAVSR